MPIHNRFRTGKDDLRRRSERPNYSGERIFKPNIAGHVELWQPDYDKLETVFRPFPAIDPEQPGQFLPEIDRDHSGREVYTGQVVEFPVLRGMGRGRLSVILDDNSRDFQTLREQSPAWILYDGLRHACDQAEKNNPVANYSLSWPRLIKQVVGKGGGRAASAPGRAAFIQGAVVRGGKGPWVHGDEEAGTKGHALTVVDGEPARGSCDGDPSVVIMLPNTAKDAFVRQYGESTTPVFDLKDGQFVHVFKTGADPRHAPRTQVPAQPVRRPMFGGSRSVQRPQGHGNTSQGVQVYDVFFSPTVDDLPGSPSADLSELSDFIYRQVRNWDDVLWFPTDTEIAHLIADLCGPPSFDYQGLIPSIPLEVFEYCWGDFPEWITPDVRRRARKAVSASVPGYASGGDGASQEAPAQVVRPWASAGRSNVQAPPPAQFHQPPAVQAPQPASQQPAAPQVSVSQPSVTQATAPTPEGATPLPPVDQGVQDAAERLRAAAAAKAAARARLSAPLPPES